MNVDDVINAVEAFGPEAIDQLFGKLVCLPCVPVQALVSLAANVAREIEARNEKEALGAAAKAVDASVDAFEEEVNAT